MATGTYQIPKDTTPSSILPYKAGDTVTFSDGQGVFFGMTTNGKIMIIMIPLPKPIASGVTVKMYGSFVAKVGTTSHNISVGSASSPVTCTQTPNGLQYQHSVGSNTWDGNAPTCLRASSGPVVLKFV